MQAQAELLSLPQALAGMFTHGCADYVRAVRGIRWGDGPIHVLTDPRSHSAGLLARYAIEDLLHRPVILREATSFLAYSLATLRTGSPVIAVSGEIESADLLQAIQAVRSNGAQVLAVAPAASPLVKAVHHLFPLPEVAGASATGLARACLEHAAMGYLAIIAARQFTRPTPVLQRLEKDWAELPSDLDKIASQFANAVRSLSQQLAALRKAFLAGAGFQYAAALRAAAAGGHRGPDPPLAVDFARLNSGWLEALGSETGALFLTGSRSRSREAATALAREIKQRGAPIFAVTDAQDHELSRHARIILLLPDRAELPASVLALALAGWVVRDATARPSAARS